MKITVLGCGNAFSKLNFNQCFMLDDVDQDGNERKMLIDFGSKIPAALDYHKVVINDITDVYISHLHSDHVGGLEELAFLRYDWINRPKFAHPSAPELHGNKKLINALWEKSLRGGLESMEGFVATLNTYFAIDAVEDNDCFMWCGWKCSPVQQIHIMNGFNMMETFGLFMEKPGHQSIYFTADSQHCSPRQIELFYKNANIIFQDCECVGVDTSQISRESDMLIESAFVFSSGVHANYAQLAGYSSSNSVKLSNEIKNKMWLSHYQDFVSEKLDGFNNACDWNRLAEEDGFAGFLKLGQVFEV